MKRVVGIFFLMGSSLLARDLTLSEAVEMSLNYGRGIKISEKQLEQSKSSLNTAFKEALPNVVYTGQAQKSNYLRQIDAGQQNAKKGYTQGIKISQPLYHGGAILAGISGAKASKNIGNLTYAAAKRDARLETITIYSKVVKYQKDLVALEASKKELEARIVKQREQLNLKLITKTDLLQTEYSLLDLEAQITGIENAIKTQKETLKVKIGIPMNEPIDVKDFNVPEDLTQRINFKKDLVQAKEKSIAALIAQDQVKIADANRKAKRGEMLPKVDAFATYGGVERRTFDDSVDKADWIGGVGVTWNVFSFGKNYDNYKVARLEKEIQEIKDNETRDNIEINVTDAYLELQRLEKVRASRLGALNAAEENYNMQKQRYEAGIISIIDYLIAESNLRQARVAYNQNIIDYYIAFEKYRSLLV
jgi:OMF family outer membrane factor